MKHLATAFLRPAAVLGAFGISRISIEDPCILTVNPLAMNSHNIRTHDVSLIDCHVKDIETFGRTLDKAAIAAFPHDGFLRYKEAHVLLLSWEDDDLGTMHEVAIPCQLTGF